MSKLTKFLGWTVALGIGMNWLTSNESANNMFRLAANPYTSSELREEAYDLAIEMENSKRLPKLAIPYYCFFSKDCNRAMELEYNYRYLLPRLRSEEEH